MYRRPGGPQGRYGQVRKISPPPRFDPRTVQPIASRYTDYATRPTSAGWEDDIKMDLQEVGWGGMAWIDLAQDSNDCVNELMNLLVS